VIRFDARRSFVAAAFAGLVGCTNAGGPSFLTLGVDVEPDTAMFGGSEPPPANQMDLCVRLPVLLGSSIERERNAQGLSVKITASREGAEVTFPGAESDGAARSYSLSEVRYGVSDVVAVTARGAAFEAIIESGCTNP
jgi:hypothetical protein